jgi:uncharacterized protein (DUF1499 family)
MMRWALVLSVVLLVVPVMLLACLSLWGQRPKELGLLAGRLRDCPATPNCVCTQATDPAQRLPPLTFSESPAEAQARLKRALATLPRTRIVTEAGLYLHAEATSLVFRFVDDLEFLVDPEARVIHFRSAARVGYSDLGANRARMERLRAAFDRLAPAVEPLP